MEWERGRPVWRAVGRGARAAAARTAGAPATSARAAGLQAASQEFVMAESLRGVQQPSRSASSSQGAGAAPPPAVAPPPPPPPAKPAKPAPAHAAEASAAAQPPPPPPQPATGGELVVASPAPAPPPPFLHDMVASAMTLADTLSTLAEDAGVDTATAASLTAAVGMADSVGSITSSLALAWLDAATRQARVQELGDVTLRLQAAVVALTTGAGVPRAMARDAAKLARGAAELALRAQEGG